MQSNKPQSDSKPETIQRPWATIFTAGFLLLFGIGASVYSYIAITWTSDSTSEVISIDSPTSSTEPANEQTDAAYLDPDRPIRTSTTRRRTMPNETRQPRTTRPATSQQQGSDSDTDSDGTTILGDDIDDGEGQDDTDGSATADQDGLASDGSEDSESAPSSDVAVPSTTG